MARANRAAAEGAGAAAAAFADCGAVFENSAVQVAADLSARMCLSLARALDPHVFLFAGGVVLAAAAAHTAAHAAQLATAEAEAAAAHATTATTAKEVATATAPRGF